VQQRLPTLALGHALLQWTVGLGPQQRGGGLRRLAHQPLHLGQALAQVLDLDQQFARVAHWASPAPYSAASLASERGQKRLDQFALDRPADSLHCNSPSLLSAILRNETKRNME